METNKQYRFEANLQLFAEGEAPAGGAGGSEAGESGTGGFNFTQGWGIPEGATAPAPTNAPVNPLFAAEPPAAPAAPPVVPNVPTPETFDIGGRKVEVTDPAIAAIMRDVQKDYSNLNSTFTKTNQEKLALEQERQTLMGLVTKFQAQAPQTPEAGTAQPTAAPQPTAEEMEAVKEKFMERFYEEGPSAIKDIVREMMDQMYSEKVAPAVEPITQQNQMNKAIAELSEKYPDFQEQRVIMSQILSDMPDTIQLGLEGVYQLSKRMGGQPQAEAPAPAPTPEQLAADPAFIQQHVLSNPDIQKQIIAQYVQGKIDVSQQVPPMMGSGVGGAATTVPETRPTTISEGSKGFRRMLGL